MVVQFYFTFISFVFYIFFIHFSISKYFRYAYFDLLGGCLLFGFYKRLVCQNISTLQGFGACHCVLVFGLKSIRFLPDFWKINLLLSFILMGLLRRPYLCKLLLLWSIFFFFFFFSSQNMKMFS